MGSTGSGSLTDYSKRKPSAFGSGGSSGGDMCGKGFSAELEDVARCFYFINTGSTTPVGTAVRVFFNGVRMAIETEKSEEIGYLPTRYNYLKSCIDGGFAYSGAVTFSSTKPVPSIKVDIVPT